MRKIAGRISLMAGAAFLAAAGASAAGFGGAAADAAVTSATFQMVRSAASVGANCLIGAEAKVSIESEGPVEVMKVSADHLPPNTDFDLFVTQVPNAPVQMYHLGLWFDSPKDATAAGCAGAITPFNGEHNAGVQALSTRNFPDQAGPLRQITS